jgi:hypothetical protein
VVTSRAYNRVMARVYNFQPLLTRAEVFKVGVTHYFVPDKPKKDLGCQYLCSIIALSSFSFFN